MAINKLTRTNDNEAEFRNQLITALTPYFTSVSYNETDKKIVCTETVGDTEKTFLTLNMGGTTMFVPTILYYLDGSNQSVGYYQTSSSVVGKIIDVKSLVTLILTAVFAVLSVRREISDEQFLTVFTTVIAFYFGTQHQKNSKEE